MLFTAVSAASAQTDSTSTSAGQTLDEIKAEYIELLGGKKHDQINFEVDGQVFWSARAIEGFTLGVIAGGTNDGFLGGVSFGYTHHRFDVDVTARMSQYKVDGQTKVVPSAFFEFKPTLFKWGGEAKSNKLYAGGRVGYHMTYHHNVVNEENDDVIIDFKNAKSGSAIAFGAVVGWEKRFFMTGHRIGIQAAVTFHSTGSSTFQGPDVSNTKTDKLKPIFELAFTYKFHLGKKVKSY